MYLIHLLPLTRRCSLKLVCVLSQYPEISVRLGEGGGGQQDLLAMNDFLSSVSRPSTELSFRALDCRPISVHPRRVSHEL